MKRLFNRLNARSVATESKPGRHADGGGLYLIVDQSGAKRWAFIFRWDGKLKEMGLGGLQAVPLANARGLAANCRAMRANGLNPIVERRTAKSAVPTFGTYALALVERIEEGFSNPKHRQQWKNTLQTYCEPIWHLPIDRVDTAGVLSCLTPIWQTKPETASRVRGRIERVLNAAKAERLRASENPAAWRGHLDATLPKPGKRARGHHKAMAFEDVPAFLESLRSMDGAAPLALEFAILTAARTGEALGAVGMKLTSKGDCGPCPRLG